MDVRSRLTQFFSSAPPVPPTAGQPAQVFIQQPPARSPVSRKTLLLACALFVAAIWICSAMFRQPSARTPSTELSAAGVDKPRIQHIIDDLSRKNAELALKQEEAAQRQAVPALQANAQPYGMQQYGIPPAPPPPAKTIEDERRERAYKSLFSSPVVAVPVGEPRATIPAPMEQVPVSPQPMPPPADARTAATEAKSPDCVDLDRLYAMCEGSIIEARLENRLVGDFSGPVNAIVERDQFSRDRQHLLIPKGTRLLGHASAATASFQQRLSVQFHRMILPDGRGVDLHSAVGLDQAGEAALKDKVDRHIPSTVATTVALGGLAAFAQMGTGGYLNANGADMFRQSVATQAGQTGQTMIGRNLNRPPSITIREGHPVEIYLNTDIHLPEFQPVMQMGFGK